MHIRFVVFWEAMPADDQKHGEWQCQGNHIIPLEYTWKITDAQSLNVPFTLNFMNTILIVCWDIRKWFKIYYYCCPWKLCTVYMWTVSKEKTFMNLVYCSFITNEAIRLELRILFHVYFHLFITSFSYSPRDLNTYVRRFGMYLLPWTSHMQLLGYNKSKLSWW